MPTNWKKNSDVWVIKTISELNIIWKLRVPKCSYFKCVSSNGQDVNQARVISLMINLPKLFFNKKCYVHTKTKCMKKFSPDIEIKYQQDVGAHRHRMSGQISVWVQVWGQGELRQMSGYSTLIPSAWCTPLLLWFSVLAWVTIMFTVTPEILQHGCTIREN